MAHAQRRAHARGVLRSVRKTADDITAETAPFLPPTDYLAFCEGHDVYRAFNTWKVALHWRVEVKDPAAPEGVRWERVSLHFGIKKKRADGSLDVGRHSKYARTWALVTGRRRTRRDRMSPRVFHGIAAIVRVVTVERDYEQEPLPVAARYSVIRRIVRVEAGGTPLRADLSLTASSDELEHEDPNPPTLGA
jgi:hypothetical protein